LEVPLLWVKFVESSDDNNILAQGTEKQLTLCVGQGKWPLFFRFCCRLLAFHSIFDLCFSCHAVVARIAHKIAATGGFRGGLERGFVAPRSSTSFGPFASGAVDVYIFSMLAEHSSKFACFSGFPVPPLPP